MGCLLLDLLNLKFFTWSYFSFFLLSSCLFFLFSFFSFFFLSTVAAARDVGSCHWRCGESGVSQGDEHERDGSIGTRCPRPGVSFFFIPIFFFFSFSHFPPALFFPVSFVSLLFLLCCPGTYVEDISSPYDMLLLFFLSLLLGHFYFLFSPTKVRPIAFYVRWKHLKFRRFISLG